MELFFTCSWQLASSFVLLPVPLRSDQSVTHPYSIKCTTTCGSGAHKHELISLKGERRKDKSNSPSLHIHVHLSSDHIPSPLPHNETVIHPHNEESRPGTSAACEGDETKMGSWESRSRSASASEWGNSFGQAPDIKERTDTCWEMKFKQISSFFILLLTCVCETVSVAPLNHHYILLQGSPITKQVRLIII